jgi:hypothetical protein
LLTIVRLLRFPVLVGVPLDDGCRGVDERGAALEEVAVLEEKQSTPKAATGTTTGQRGGDFRGTHCNIRRYRSGVK